MFEKLKSMRDKNSGAFNFFFVAVAVIIAYKIIMNIEGVVFALKAGLGWLKSLLMPFIVGFVIAYLLNPAVNFFERKVFGKIKKLKKGKTVLSVIIVYIITAALLVVVLNMLIPLLVRNISDIVGSIPSYMEKITEFRNGNWNGTYLGKIIFNAIVAAETWITDTFTNYNFLSLNPAIIEIVGGVVNATGLLLDVVFGVIISIYFILDKYKLVRGIKRIFRAFFKEETCLKVGSYTMEAHGIFSRFIAGKFIDSLIIGIICIIGLNILNVENSALYGVIVGVTNMIPYFGPFIGAVPVVVLVLFESPLKAVWVGLFIFALQQFDGMILGPKILGDSIDLSPFWIIFAIIIGGGLFGVAGMFLGAPALAVILLAVDRVVERRLEKKNVMNDEERIVNNE